MAEGTRGLNCCLYCERTFRSRPYTNRRRKACDRSACQQARKRDNCRQWLSHNPGYSESRSPKLRLWAKSHPHYWRHYRKENPKYYERDLERRRKSYHASVLSAKHNLRRREDREILAKLEAISTNGFSAKQIVRNRRVAVVLDYLLKLVHSAKQKPLASS